MPPSLTTLPSLPSNLLLPQRRHRRAISHHIRLPRRRMLPHPTCLLALTLRLPTPTTRALPHLARTLAVLSLALTRRLPIRATLHTRLLQVRESPRLGVDISHLLIAHGIKASKFLPRGGPHRLLKVRIQ